MKMETLKLPCEAIPSDYLEVELNKGCIVFDAINQDEYACVRLSRDKVKELVSFLNLYLDNQI